MDERTKKLIWFAPEQAAAIEAYARDHGLIYGGQPHFSAAVRQLVSVALGASEDTHQLRLGRPTENPTDDIDST